MKKIIYILLILFTYSSVNAENITDDYLYFPGGDYGVFNSISKSSFNPISDKPYNGDFYKVLFGESIYKSHSEDEVRKEKYRKLLFETVFYALYNEQKLIIADNNKEEYEKHIIENDKEVKLAKLRYDSYTEAEKDYNEIISKLNPVIELYFKTGNYEEAKLNIRRKEICNYKINNNFTFQTTNYKESFKIKQYYLFGKNINHYEGAPWYKRKSQASIISTKGDIEKMNKEMFFIKEVFPNKMQGEVTEIYYDNVSSPGEEQVMKPFSRNIQTTELNFSLNIKDFLNYFKENNKLYETYYTSSEYREGISYSFGKNEGGKVNLELILLGIDENNDVIVLTNESSNDYEFSDSYPAGKEKTKLNFDLNDGLLNKKYLKEICEKKYSGNIEPHYRLLKTIFMNLDIIYTYGKFIIFDQRILTEEQQRNKNYPRYEKKLINLENKVSQLSNKNNDEINKLLELNQEELLENRKNLEKLYTTRNLINTILTEIKIRKQGIKDYFKISTKFENETSIKVEGIDDFSNAMNIKKYYEYISNKQYSEAFDMKYNSWYNLEYFKNLYKDTDRVFVAEIINSDGLKNDYRLNITLYNTYSKIPEKYKVRIQIIDGKLKQLSSKLIN